MTDTTKDTDDFELEYSLRDLAERADDRGEGEFWLHRSQSSDRRPHERWEAAMRDRGGQTRVRGRGPTPRAALRKLIEIQERTGR